MKYIFGILIICFYSIASIAQDKHFSQFYSNPMSMNPAMSGLFDGRYRIGVNYRDQGRGSLDFPFRTFAGSFDLKFEIPRQSQYKDYYGIGLLFYTDRVSGFEFNTTNLGISAAYHKALNPESNQYLSLGFQGGVVQRTVNYDNFIFQDQFNGTTGFTYNTREPLPDNTRAFGDYSVGLQYTSAPSNKLSYYIGATLQHIGAPRITLKEYSNVANSKLYRLYSGYVGVNIPVGYNLQLAPKLYVASQGPHLEMVGGNNFRFLLADKTALITGPWVRFVKNDKSTNPYSFSDFIGLVGIEYNKIVVSVSYDYSFTAYRNKFGAMELSISYIGSYDDDDDFCPRF